MGGGITIDFAHPANREILAWLAVGPGDHVALAPGEVDPYRLGTHPDLLESLWSLGGPDRPCACAIASCAAPLLAEPGGGVIFGVAGGTGTLGMRLPEPHRAEALATPGFGASVAYPTGPVMAAQLGPDWALLRPFDPRNVDLFQVARAHAATLLHW